VTHVSTGRMPEMVNKVFVTFGFAAYAKKNCVSSKICMHNNQRGNVRPKQLSKFLFQ